MTKTLSEKATVAQEREQMRLIEAIGYSRFGRYGQGISYNVLVFPSGRAYQGVDFNRRGCHTDQRNSTARSICFVGNYENAKPTEAQLETAARILAEGYGKWWEKTAPRRGHRELKSTACPGRHVWAQKAAIEKRAKKIAAGGTTKAPAKGKLAVNGLLDAPTITALQKALGVKQTGKFVGMKTVDGKIRVTGPDSTVKALQRRFKTTADGNISVPKSQLVSALQRHFKCGPVDGYISAGGSNLVKKMQSALNSGKFSEDHDRQRHLS